MKKIFLSFLLVMAGISHTLAQGLDGNVEQRLKDFFTQYETSYANIGKCKLGRYEVNHNQKKLDVYASSSFGYQPFQNRLINLELHCPFLYTGNGW